MAVAWQNTSRTWWLGDIPPRSLEEQLVLGSADEGHTTDKSWVAGYSDAEEQSSLLLRKRHCDDVGKAEFCWAEQQQQEQQQAAQQSHLLKRVCSGLNFTSWQTGGAQPWAHLDEQQLCSEPCSPGATCPSEASAPHCGARSHTPTAGDARGDAAALAAATAVANQQPPQQGKVVTRASSSRSAAAQAGSVLLDAAPAASSRASSKRPSRKPSDSVSASSMVKAGGPQHSSKASRAGSGSSSGSSACRGPRVRLGGRLLSAEEAEACLRQAAAAAHAAAAKAAAAKVAALKAAATPQGVDAAAPAATAVAPTEPPVSVRPPSPRLEATIPAAAAETAEDPVSMNAAAGLAAGADASTTCSPVLQSSIPGLPLMGCQADKQAAAAAVAGAAGQQQHELEGYRMQPAAGGCAATLQADFCVNSAALQQVEQRAAADAAAGALAAAADEHADDDDLYMPMLHDQLAYQLPDEFEAAAHQAGDWPGLEQTLGGLHMPAAAAAADAVLIGSACSAAGCNADSLAAAVDEEEAAHEQQQRAFKASPLLLSGPSSACAGSLACPGGSPHAAAAAFPGMHSRDSSSASGCETALLQCGSYHSSLARSRSIPIRLPGSRPDSRPDASSLTWLPGSRPDSRPDASSLTWLSGCGASSLAASGSPSLSGQPGLASSSMPCNMSCNSFSTMHDGGSAALPGYDPAAAAAAAVVAQSEAEQVDAELQQLLAEWTPDEAPCTAAAPAAAAVCSHQAASAPAVSGGFSQQLGSSVPQQQVGLSLPVQGQQPDVGSGPGSNAGMPRAMSDCSAESAGFGASLQWAPTQLAWKPAFVAAAPDDGSSSAALSVTVPISVPAAGSAVSLQCVSPFLSCSSMQGAAPAAEQAACPAGRRPRARKGKASGSKASKQPPQQLAMQLQVPACALPAAVPRGAHVVLHLKPSQQQQLMAVVDRLVQQRLAQTYEAGYRAAAHNISNSMMAGGIVGGNSMPPPAPVQHPPQQVQAGLGSSPTAAGGARAAGPVANESASMSMSALAALPLLQPSTADGAAAAAAAAVAGMEMPGVDVCGVSDDGLRLSDQQQLPPSAVPRQAQLGDDILPSMQDLLTDCCD